MRPFSRDELQRVLGSLDGGNDYVFLDSARCDEENSRSLLFRSPRKLLECHQGDDPEQFLLSMQQALAQGYHLAGWLGYEFGYLLEPCLAPLLPPLNPGTCLASFGVFDAPQVFDHRAAPASPPTGDTGGKELSAFSVDRVRPGQSREDYLAAIGRIKEYIRAGDTYQVNYTLKLLFDFVGSPEAFYQSLRRNQSVAYGAILRFGREHILSCSPELFFRIHGGTLTVRPMKGTMRRGRYPEEELAFARALREDEKNRSENVMIVDLLRNDLGCLMHQMGDPRVVTRSLFDVEHYESLLQMTSTISVETGEPLLDRVALVDLFRALFPCGSVTGAPKIRTMEIIRELEQDPRGVYTGAIGYLAPTGEAVFNVPIRTLRIAGGRGEMGIGSGIVYDSDPEQEWEECLLKGYFLTRPRPEFVLFETLLWEPGQGYWLQGEHLDRLEASAAYFSFHFDRRRVEECLTRLGRQLADQTSRVRLTLAKDGRLQTAVQSCEIPRQRGLGGGGNNEAEDMPRLGISASQVDSASCWYFHKTSRRELYQEEFARAGREGLFDVCFFNERGELTEGCISNLILCLDGAYVTPPISCGLLAGTLRARLLADESNILRERVLSREDLLRAEAIYCCNSVRGVVRVCLDSEDY